ncbi:MAG: hypothetical protein ACXU8Q_03995 [Caulobacteraceae bacterium]
MRGARVLGAILAAWSLTATGPAFALPFIGKKPAPAAKPAPQPAAAAPTAPATPASALDIKGFRSATFGMTPAQVKTAIAKDFGAGARLQEGANADGTQFITTQLDHLDPGPGAAQVGYVFGAASKTLTNVNVVWSTPGEATEPQRLAVAQAGEQLVSYFRSGPAPAKASNGVVPFGTNGLLLFTGIDRKNAAVQVMIDGVEYKSTGGDKPVASPPPKGKATLRLSYALDIDKPDVRTLKPGSF